MYMIDHGKKWREKKQKQKHVRCPSKTRPVQAIAVIRLIFHNLINTKIEFFVNGSMSNSNLAHIHLFPYNLFMGHLPYCHRIKTNWICSGRWAQFRMIVQNGSVNGDFTCLSFHFFFRRSILVSRAQSLPSESDCWPYCRKKFCSRK